MPVGNSDRGIGLWAGQIMFGLNSSNEYIDWWHDVLPNSQETIEHEGRMVSFVFSPSLTIGFSNYLNISLSQFVGVRSMIWEGNGESIHHRTEGSNTSFSNALGGLLGDTRLLARYLIKNTGKGSGSRLFLGGGLSFPSKNTLTSDPFFLKNKDEMTDHRHFSMSDGCYKAIGETQMYYKQTNNPVFFGGSFLVETPIKENEYGYKSPTLYDLSFTAITNERNKLKTSFSLNLGLIHTTSGFWHGIKAPNTKTTITTPSVGFLKNTSLGSISVSLLKPVFIYGGFSGSDDEVDSKVKAWRVNVGFRRLFDYVIPWLDPMKNL